MQIFGQSGCDYLATSRSRALTFQSKHAVTILRLPRVVHEIMNISSLILVIIHNYHTLNTTKMLGLFKKEIGKGQIIRSIRKADGTIARAIKKATGPKAIKNLLKQKRF